MEEANRADNLTNSNAKLLPFIKFMYIAAALGVIIINFGNFDTIIISRYICLVIVMIVNIIMIVCQVKYDLPNKFPNISLMVWFIILLCMYIYYINLYKNENILNNVYSNYFLYLFIIISIFLSFNLSLEISLTIYCILLIIFTIKTCLMYPLIIQILYYKTDGYKNIYI